MSCTSKIVSMASINLELGLVHRVRQNVTSEGQQKGQRVSGFGSCVPDKAGELEAGHAKGCTKQGWEHGHCIAGRKGTGWWCFSPSEEKTGISKIMSHWNIVWSWILWEFEEYWGKRCSPFVGEWLGVRKRWWMITGQMLLRGEDWADRSETVRACMARQQGTWAAHGASGCQHLVCGYYLKQQPTAGLVCVKEDVSDRCCRTSELLMQLLSTQNTA